MRQARVLVSLVCGLCTASAFIIPAGRPHHHVAAAATYRHCAAAVRLSSTAVEEEELLDDKIITMTPKALTHLQALKKSKEGDGPVVLRMGVRSGGCSGLSYVMDLVTEEEIEEEDMIEEYPEHGFKCAIDPKSMLYLYGLQLDYSDALIGGGFQFQNPNAESSCGCGKSFGV
eukprot:TRINITY_DN8880_c0_g1_i1.p1 TRINITY_DN8880_c0_g1~~TRINITY_DN8880_c0_g1_i1.p1  ORF type:complete len:173 (-),score=64.48 TRINITY_DN8880_c0_g1_i1:1674-2192(-)